MTTPGPAMARLASLARKLIGKFVSRYPRTGRFLVARFSREGYLGLHLTIGLALSVAGLWLFLAIAEDVVNQDPITLFDMRVFDWMHAHSLPAEVSIFRIISALGSPVMMLTLAAVVGIIFAIQRKRILLIGWVAAFAGSLLIDAALKWIIRRPRPPGAASALHHLSYSFPSGHAMGSLIGYGMLGYVIVGLWGAGRELRTLVIILCAFLVIAVGISRLYLGVHFVSDVIGGWGAGLLWLSACISGLEATRRMPPHPAAPVSPANEAPGQERR